MSIGDSLGHRWKKRRVLPNKTAGILAYSVKGADSLWDWSSSRRESYASLIGLTLACIKRHEGDELYFVTDLAVYAKIFFFFLQI